MFATIRRLGLLGLGAVLFACSARPAPPVKRYALGMARAEYRDYAGARANPCDAEQRWLADELTAVNGLLARYLRDTEKLESAESLALAEEASRTLPPVLEAHRGTLAALERCSFRRSGAFPEISRRGAELVAATGERLKETPALLEKATLGVARAKWKAEAPQREAAGRSTWCTDKPQVGRPDVYYVRQELDGRTTWHFCDGHRVEQEPGGEPKLVEPEGLTRRERRLVQPKAYLEAAANFPAEEMDRPPEKAPAPAPAKAAAGNPG